MGNGPWAGRRAAVTGGASGIGLAIGRALAAEGARVALLDRREDADAVARSIGAFGVRVDVRELAAVREAASAVVAELGGVDLVVCSAGVSVAGRFEDVSPEDFDWLLQINLFGTVHTCRAFLPHLGAGGHIVCVSSSFAWLGFPGKSAYGASKAAVRAFAESLRAELAPRRIGVSVLYPGPVDTNLLRDGVATDPAQRDAEIRFLRSRAIPAERVARRCLSGVRANRARIVVSLDYRAIDLLARLSPRLALWLVAWLDRRMPF